jgi:branched-chain amino acid transport system permease protein
MVTGIITAVITGVLIGCVYSLIALGIVLIYKTTQVFNLAQGEMLLIGTWLTWTMITVANLPFWLSLIIALLFSILLGMLIERFILRPMLGQPLLPIIMITIGIFSLLRGISIYFWGGEVQSFPPLFPIEVITIGFIPVSTHLLAAAIMATLLVIVTYAYFRFTRGGLAMMATAENVMIAQSLGTNVKAAFSRSWAISAMVGTLSGVLLGSIMGIFFGLSDLSFKAFPVIILGGLESIPGVLVAGPIMGICESLGATFLDPMVGGGIGDIVPYVVMLIVLVIRPSGLFGYKIIERV